ncbi:MAG: small-conductance mechanosensitive channel MscS [Armatimonadaceae bacterium]
MDFRLDQFTLENIVSLLTFYGLKVLAAAIIFLVGRWVVGIIRSILEKVLSARNVDPTLITFVTRLVYVLLFALVIIAALSQLGVQTASFVAIIGAAGLAIGLALQGSLSNFAAGVLMIIFRPFKVGDYIEGGDASGTVDSVDIFTTVLRTIDNKRIIVPNSKILSNNITNFSAEETRRVDMVIGVSYSDDLDKVRRVLKEVLAEEERILPEPEPMIVVLELADSSVNIGVRPWVKTPDYWGVYWDTIEKIKKRFDSEGISIPFPQRDIHLYEEKVQRNATAGVAT